VVVVVIAAWVYNNNFSFSIVFVKSKKHTYRLEGAMPPSPSSYSSVLLPLLPPLVLLWARGCVVEMVVEGAGCDVAAPPRCHWGFPRRRHWCQ